MNPSVYRLHSTFNGLDIAMSTRLVNMFCHLSVAMSAALLSSCERPLTDTPALSLAPPAAIMQVRAVDQASLRPRVTLSGNIVVEMTQNTATDWSGTVNLLPDTNYRLRIVWLENFDERELDLAIYEKSISVGSTAQALSINGGDYDLSLDFDSDGISNLDELENNTDPFMPELAQPDTIDVVIPRITRNKAPQIDGLGAETNRDGKLLHEWASAVQFDTHGNALHINNLMIDVSAEAADGAPYRRWAAMHDGEYLYLLILVDDVGRRHSDSATIWNDDSVELFLDSDNSKLTHWGDADDFHLLLPLLPQNASASNTDQNRFELGPNSSQASIDVRFTTGPGIGPDGVRQARWEQDVYEIRVDLESAGILPGFAFGLELQVNDDDNGSARDSKWGWHHPSRSRENTDQTWLDPSFMGTALLGD